MTIPQSRLRATATFAQGGQGIVFKGRMEINMLQVLKKYYLAIDIGASSGRHMLACFDDGKIVLEEIYRFENGNDVKDGHRIWDVDRLFSEIIAGMKKCGEEGKIPVSVGIDTWGVDYVLLDRDDKRIAPCYAYRDGRTEGMDKEVYKIISEDDLYARTGIQKAIFNTIYQLTAQKINEPEALERAESFLMIPDYFNFLLTGVKKQEYTNATTTQLVGTETYRKCGGSQTNSAAAYKSCEGADKIPSRDYEESKACMADKDNAPSWDYELIEMLGLPKKIFKELSMPGTFVGNLLPEIKAMVGYDTKVVLPATHDTGSAVMSIPSTKENVLYISSGTWSLLGCELEHANCSDAARKANFTNEGGYELRYRFLKNIMGLWMIQSVKKEFEMGKLLSKEQSLDRQDDATAMEESTSQFVNYGNLEPCEDYSFSHLCEMASRESIDSIVDANDSRFLAPDSMIEEIKSACRESGMEVPESPWRIARVIYRSLAECYKKAADEIEIITGKKFDSINIVGGGAKADYLNELTAKATGRTVYAGPFEATAIGNIGAQMIADGVFEGLKEFRASVNFYLHH